MTKGDYEGFYQRAEQGFDVRRIDIAYLNRIRRGKPSFQDYRNMIRIASNTVKLRSGREINAFRVSSRTYLTFNKKTRSFQARDFRTGRLRSMKRFLKYL